jgi:rod shape-determining protein MreC
VPRNRSARVAVLGNPAQRAASSPYSSRASSALRRRIVLGVLVVLSLALITVYFKESDSGALHGLQGTGATVLRPFEVGAERVAAPFRDAFDWFRGLVNAKSENGKLRAEVDRLRQEVIQNQTAAADNKTLKQQLSYVDSPQFPADFTAINARVIVRAPGEFDQQVVISAGSAEGVTLHAPVVTADGLVGDVTRVTAHESRVTLLTDEESAVTAVDLKTGALGSVRHGQGGGLILDRVSKDQQVADGDTIITAGTQSADLPDLYPRGIPIGKVTSVGQSDTALYKQIQVSPFVAFGGLDSVVVLRSLKPAPTLP